MVLSKTLLTLGLATLASRVLYAAAVQSFTVNYNFDRIPATPLILGPETREYDLLSFQNINTLNQSLALTGVVPHTESNSVGFTVQSELVDLDGTDVRITSKYFRSTISSFDAISWYYACALGAATTLAGLPADCTITATGYNTAGKKTAQQSFTYTATALRQNFTYAEFGPHFVGLQYITLVVSNNLTTVGNFDDFVATLRQSAGAAFY